MILVDTSVLIDFYRKTDKTNSVWIELLRQGYEFAVSTITKYEIYSGATQSQLDFWNNIY
ncbi:PIN domain-containing protein [Compostibacter hankyongensis]